jgi:hypothetical protein
MYVLKHSLYRNMHQVKAIDLERANFMYAFLYPLRDIIFFVVEGIACFDEAERDASVSTAAVT